MEAKAHTLPGHVGAEGAPGFGCRAAMCPREHCHVVPWDVGHGMWHPGQRSPVHAPALQQQLKHYERITRWLQPFSQDVFIFKRKLFQMLCVWKQKEDT